MFQEEVSRSPDPDIQLIQFILRRMTQIGSPDLAAGLLARIEVLYPILPDIVRYLTVASDLNPSIRTQIGAELVSLFRASIVSELKFHRLWLMVPFADSTSWGQGERFMQLLGVSDSTFARRKLILAMGRACQDYWFSSTRKRVMDEAPWPRRAFLMGASCMPVDARRHWFRSIEPKLDLLERVVVRYARDHPFRK
jgi:hypothetical protein